METILTAIFNLIQKYLRIDKDGNRLVETGDVIVPYQETTYTLAAGERIIVYQVFDYFRVLAQVGGTLKVAFGQNGREVPYQGSGIGYNAPTLFDRVTLINSHATDSMTITVGLANGKISDDRLNVSGIVNVAGDVSIDSPATLVTAADVSVLTTATTQIFAANALRKEAFISNPAVNNTVIRVGDSNTGAARGIEVPIGGTATLTTQGAIYVYNPSASTIAIGNAYTQ